MDFWDRHPRWFIFGVAVLVVAAILALPIVIYCVVCQAIFIAAIFVLNILIPKPTTVVAFHLGSGFLNSGIGAAIGFFLLLGRWTIDIIKIRRVYIVANILFFIATFCVAIQNYHDAISALLPMPGSSIWAFVCSDAFLKGGLSLVIFVALVGLCILSIMENRKIKQDVQNGTYVRRFELPQWLAWAKVENVYGSRVSAIPQPPHQQPAAPPPAVPPQSSPAPVTQNFADFDRAEWYKQIARENAGHTQRQS